MSQSANKDFVSIISFTFLANVLHLSLITTPLTSLSNDKKMIVIEAQKSGVSDVSVRTESTLYQLRFVIGPEFQDESKDLIMIDLPSVLLGGN